MLVHCRRRRLFILYLFSALWEVALCGNSTDVASGRIGRETGRNTRTEDVARRRGKRRSTIMGQIPSKSIASEAALMSLGCLHAGTTEWSYTSSLNGGGGSTSFGGLASVSVNCTWKNHCSFKLFAISVYTFALSSTLKSTQCAPFLHWECLNSRLSRLTRRMCRRLRAS